MYWSMAKRFYDASFDAKIRGGFLLTSRILQYTRVPLIFLYRLITQRVHERKMKHGPYTFINQVLFLPQLQRKYRSVVQKYPCSPVMRPTHTFRTG
jgi:hypothetical protein